MDLAPKPYYWPDEKFGGSPPLGTRSGWLALGCMPFVLYVQHLRQHTLHADNMQCYCEQDELDYFAHRSFARETPSISPMDRLRLLHPCASTYISIYCVPYSLA